MNQTRYLLKGTALLTAANLLTRVAGFFYKIFLSRKIGAEQIGLFQLSIPVFILCMSVSASGIQTAVSRFCAETLARNEKLRSRNYLLCGLSLSVFLSILCALSVFIFSDWIASRFLLVPACSILLRFLALSLPFAAVHACINGYFIAIKKISFSALSNLLEQAIRIFTVLIICIFSSQNGKPLTVSIMGIGQFAGELAAAIYSVSRIGLYCQLFQFSLHRNTLVPLLSFAVPLSLNRILLSVLQTIEAALLPVQMQYFGMTESLALSAYGTLTGMALPFILFPTAITASISMLLLPLVSASKAVHNEDNISNSVNFSVVSCSILGIIFTLLFILFGPVLGQWVYHNQTAGMFIRKLAPLCPFLYIYTTLAGILHGLGYTAYLFIWNLIGYGIRLFAVFFLVPKFGIDSYLTALFLSNFFTCGCSLYLLKRCNYISFLSFFKNLRKRVLHS